MPARVCALAGRLVSLRFVLCFLLYWVGLLLCFRFVCVFLFRCGVLWLWFGLVWFGFWFGLVWFGLVWFGLVSVWFGLVRFRFMSS